MLREKRGGGCERALANTKTWSIGAITPQVQRTSLHKPQSKSMCTSSVMSRLSCKEHVHPGSRQRLTTYPSHFLIFYGERGNASYRMVQHSTGLANRITCHFRRQGDSSWCRKADDLHNNEKRKTRGQTDLLIHEMARFPDRPNVTWSPSDTVGPVADDGEERRGDPPFGA